MKRRHFVGAGTTLILGACAQKSTKTVKTNMDSSGNDVTTKDVLDDINDKNNLPKKIEDNIEPPIKKAICETSSDILGPFYRENAPERSLLVQPCTDCSLVNIQGSVLSIADCETPLENILIEIWHADESGEYDNSSHQFIYRASQRSQANGSYEFQTILPGKYLNGRNYRPAHYHFRISDDTGKELVTQVYFQNDPAIASDPWASEAGDRILTLIPETQNGVLNTYFDIYF